MRIVQELFSTDVGLMSVVGLAFMLGMGVFFLRYFFSHMRQDAKAASASKA